MPDLPTRAELFSVGAAEIATRSAARPGGQRINPEQVFVEGSDMNIVTASSSAMGDEVMRQVSLRAQALMLLGAKNEDLDRIVADRFSPTVVRKDASPAIGEVVITRASGALPALVFPIGTRFKTAGGVEFDSLYVASLAAGSNGPVTVP